MPVQDLIRVDFVHFSAPAALLQGYSGPPSLNPSGMPSNPLASAAENHLVYPFPGALEALMARPQTLTIGDPGAVPEPVWNQAAPGPPVVPAASGGVASRIWKFQYDGNSAEVTSMTDPQAVTTQFSYGDVQTYYTNLSARYSDGGCLIRGVTQAIETDTATTGQVRTRTWARSLSTPTNGSPWTVSAQDCWSRLGSADCTTVYAYPSWSNFLDYANKFLQRVDLQDASGTPWATTRYASVTGGGVQGGGLDISLSLLQSVTTTRQGENGRQVTYTFTDSTDLQPSTITSQVLVGGTYQTYASQQFQYNNRWPMLETQQVSSTTTTRYAPFCAATAAVATTQVWDPSNLLELQATYRDGGTGYQHGKTYGYDGQGRVVSQGVWHQDPGSSAPVPPAQAISYDDGTPTNTGQPTLWQTTWPDVGASGTPFTAVLSRAATGFDGGGRPTVRTDEKGVTTTVSYDLYGRVTSSTTQGLATVSTRYPDNWTIVQTQAGMQTTLASLEARLVTLEKELAAKGSPKK